MSRGAVHFEAPGADGIGRIVIDRLDDSVNAVNPQLIEDLGATLRMARASDGLRGLIVASGKPTQFMAGADLKMVARTTDAAQLAGVSRRFQAVLDELAWLPCTVVAAINGPALGAGFELALACDYRVAIDAPNVRVGQPEVSLGLVPAGGGTQRLPRLLGIQAALELILGGRRLSARRAARAGVLDEVVHPLVLGQAARAWANKPKRPLDRPLHLGLSVRAAVDVLELTSAGRQLIYRQARAAVLARTHGHYPAPLKALEAVQIGFEQGMAAGLQAESQAFAELARTPTARNLIWFFLTTQGQKRVSASLGPPRQDDESSPQSSKDRRSLDRVAVVGAGFMGAAIAEVAAAAGMAVRVRDVKPEAVAAGLSSIRKIVDDGLARGRFDRGEARQILQRVSGTTDYSGFSQADLVIEAVFEEVAIKQTVIRELDARLRPDAVIASNTSAIPIKEIASASTHAERIVGMHFFSPAQRMPLLEIIQPAAAADWAVRRAVAVGAKMGKTAIVVQDSPGFYTSRVLGVMMNEAALLLGEGARIEDVDRAMTAFGFPVGPFVLYDEVGLAVALHAGETLASAFGDRLPADSIVPQLVAAGQTGRKAGAGFYLWHTSLAIPQQLRRIIKRPNRTPNPDVYRIAAAPAQRTFGEQAIQDRLALLFVNEAIRCLDEGVLQSPADGDLGAVLGLGFPPFTGGPFHYADRFGLSALVQRLSTLAAAHGRRYEPAQSVLERAGQGHMFFEE
ncbi:MAG: enoyl-CoA hydratase/isomerase family protein [Chloroflexi bacterium]|nr:enoyl-CoA hydratase/isomerase family protein [Chloroflexota bacterium]